MIAATSCFAIVLRFRDKIKYPIQVFGNRFNDCIRLNLLASIYFGSCKTIATQASPNEGETGDVVNQNFVSGETTPKFSQETCIEHIKKLCTAGSLSEAARLLQSLRDKSIFYPDAYNVLLAAAGEKNDIDVSSQIFKDFLLSCGPLSSTCYDNLARSFAKTTDSTTLVSFVEEISELAFPESTVVINRIICAFAESRQIEKALLIYDQLKSIKCKPDLFTYNIVLNAFGQAGRMDQMLHEFASMKETGIGPDLITYNILLTNLSRVGRLDMSLLLFREMTESGIQPDFFSYTAMIELFGRSGNIEEALRLFNEMKQRQIRPAIQTYRALINYLKKSGMMELSMTLREEMNSFMPDLAKPRTYKRKSRYR